MKEHWMADPEEHDYPAASDYLTLVMPKVEAAKRIEELRRAPVELRKAKDLLRASRLKLLGKDNYHVAKDLEKVKAGKKLSPVLVVRGDINRDAPMLIADGYHRICASYLLDENADIPCRIAG
jgi:hypothetical protein